MLRTAVWRADSVKLSLPTSTTRTSKRGNLSSCPVSACKGRIGRFGALLSRLALAAVDHNGDDAVERFPFRLQEYGIEQGKT